MFASIMLKIMTALVLFGGVAALRLAGIRNPALFSLEGCLLVKFMTIMLFALYTVSATNKLLIIFNKILPIFTLLGCSFLMIILCSIFFLPFVNFEASANTSYWWVQIAVVIVWLLWDAFMLSVYIHALFAAKIKDLDDKNSDN